MENYKYNIEKILDSLPHSEHALKLKEIEAATNLTYQRIHQIRKLKKSDKSVASPEILMKIANCLGVDLEELLNVDTIIRKELVTVIEYKTVC